MTNTLHAIAIWTHILGIALFVGPQFFLAFAWVPASRGIADLQTRVSLMRKLTRSFGFIGGAGLLLILIAGMYLISTWRTYYGIGDVGFNDIRYGFLFSIKMALLLIMLIVVGLHTFVVGPRLLRLYEIELEGTPVDEAPMRRARMNSMLLSITGLLLALAIMVFGALMNTAQFSLQDM